MASDIRANDLIDLLDELGISENQRISTLLDALQDREQEGADNEDDQSPV